MLLPFKLSKSVLKLNAKPSIQFADIKTVLIECVVFFPA